MRTKVEVEVEVTLGGEGLTIDLVGVEQGGDRLYIPMVQAVVDHIAQVKQPGGLIGREDLQEMRAMMETARVCALTLEATISGQAKMGNHLPELGGAARGEERMGAAKAALIELSRS
jgi:hypothetical protein